MEPEIVKVTITGAAPMLMNRYILQCEQPTRSRSEKKQNERDSGRWTEKVYWSDTMKCVAIPSVMIEACLAAGARAFKLGKQVQSTVFLAEDEVPVISHGKKIDKLEVGKQIELDGRGAVVMKRRVDRFRPMLRDWQLSFTVQLLDPTAFSRADLNKVVEHAGRFCGLGDFRPRFGRFSVV